MSKRILIVDDSRVLLMITTKLLKEIYPDCEVNAYSKPSEAFADIKVNSYEFYFALIDYNMPGMTGIELIEQLVQLPHEVLKIEHTSLLSANIQEAVQQKATDLGIDFIPKPLDKEKLISFLDRKGISYE